MSEPGAALGVSWIVPFRDRKENGKQLPPLLGMAMMTPRMGSENKGCDHPPEYRVNFISQTCRGYLHVKRFPQTVNIFVNPLRPKGKSQRIRQQAMVGLPT